MKTALPRCETCPSVILHGIEAGTLAAAVEHAADGIMMTDTRGTIQYVNPSFTAMTGYSSEEAVGQNPRILKSGCHSSRFYKELWTTIRSGQVWRSEMTNRRKDGTTYQEELRISPVHDADGVIVRYVAIKRDITERRQAEAALRESEVRFRCMADSCPSQMWVTDAEGRVEFINRLYREFSGMNCEEARAGKWRSLIHPDDAPQYLAAFDSAVRERRAFSAEGRVRRADGVWRMIGSRGEPRFSPNGKYMGHIGLRADITERRKAEQERQFQHSLISAIYEGSHYGIFVVDPQHTVVSHNEKFLEVWKFSFPGPSGEPLTSIVGMDQHQVLSAALREVKDPEGYLKRVQEHDRDTQSSDRGEVELRDGRTLEWHSNNLRDGSGQHLGRALFFRDITARIKGEQALRETEERFRTMADGCPMPLWITNARGEIEFVNTAFNQFNGGNFEHVKGSNWQHLLHPEDAPRFLRECFRALEEHRSFREETRVQRSDGAWRWLAAFAAPRLSTNGEFLGHVGLGTDITERKQAEQALQQSEEKFRELTENIREILWLKEPGKAEFLYVSPAYEQIFGRTCASFYENPASRLEAIHPDDLEQSRRVFAQQDRGEAAEIEYRIRTPDGQEKWIRSRAFPVLDGAGKPFRIAGIAEDITEKKQYEAHLIRAQMEAEDATRRLIAQHAVLDAERKILRAFIDNVPDLMCVRDVEGRFVVANPELARWAGVERPEDMIGKTDYDFFPSALAEIFDRDVQHVIGTGEPIFNHEVRVGAGAQDEVSYLQTTKVPLLDGEGRVTGIAGIGRDITARRRNEDALRESNRQLREATERANQLAFAAEEANRAKSEFLANMSHEIRTPMNGVLGMIDLLLGSGLEAEQRHYAEVAEESAKSLLTVIDDILDFSKVEAGKLEIDNLDFNLYVLMGDLADTLAGRVDEKQVELVCAVAPSVCALLQGDPGRLRQVLMNLVGNAIKFTHRGEVVVRVDPIAETPDGVTLRFSVRDTGIGIPADKQPRLFTSFTQVDASTTRQYGGTGLGLAISKKLVELMGGEIGMESEEGQGSEFWFTLRLAKQHHCKQLDSSNAPVKGARILIVDDNATNREVLTAEMQSWGAIVVAAEDGSTALARMRFAAAAGNPFQAAVLDMMMPGMDGAALGAAILADDALKSTPLVMMTSLGRRGDALRFKEIGFAAYLVKPVRQQDLFDCLVAVLTGEQEPRKRTLITRHSLETARRSSARILLVEDNPTNQEVASGLLRRMGWHADVKANGRQAIRALEAEPYDLVLMDVQMPEMDGYEATRIIRDSQSAVLNHKIPIIATTAHAMSGDAERCFEAGMSDYIAKPIDPNTLFSVVEKWLTRRVDSQASGAAVDSATECSRRPESLPGESPVFNGEAFLQRMMGDVEFAREVAEGFAGELPAMLIELREKAALEALEPICKLAHKIKGAAANVGGEALRDVALEMELAGKGGDLARVVRLVPDLETQAGRLSEALRKWTR
ncbi:MAG TPA: PAS domain S-box protein [Terracidiphilus sp.]|nr:PAS domain S-box protein [Terracidiphilus sp.]